MGSNGIGVAIRRVTASLGAAAMLAIVGGASADERFFTYNQEADVLPKGGFEFEQWITYRRGNPGGDRAYDQNLWDLREEFEYGITDKLSGAMYLNFRHDEILARSSTNTSEERSKFSFKGVSLELKYQLLNPHTDPVGVALYFEPTFSGSERELEYKLIFSKNVGDNWVLASNLNFEQEWEREDGETERESVFEWTLGAAYRITPNWSVGLEGRYHAVYEGSTLNEKLGSAWFVGPNIHYATSKWWATFTILPQISGSPSDRGSKDLVEHQRYEARLIFGLNF